ncbi:hypothetical protein FHG87_019311 [Trinorchestia longiramus]|nr:hypothetical protein FHG87_019311 [Trinorchestia longiramus]
MAPQQTSTATRLAFIKHGENRTEEVNQVTRLGSITTRSTTATNKRSRSGSIAQPNAHYEEAATLWVTDSLLSASKVNISIRTLITWRKLTDNSRTKEAQISHPVCGQNGAQQFKH